MRFKPPPPNSSIGWRVEFRPCEVQITDFENAAIVCFVVLLTRVILSYKLNLLIPISKVDENMARAQKRDAVRNEKFTFRRDITSSSCDPDNRDEFTEYTVDEIINGKEGVFPGLVPLVNSYLASMNGDADTYCTIQRYLKFIQRRASGELLTTAAWLRKEVTTHPEYKSVLVLIIFIIAEHHFIFSRTQKCHEIEKKKHSNCIFFGTFSISNGKDPFFVGISSILVTFLSFVFPDTKWMKNTHFLNLLLKLLLNMKISKPVSFFRAYCRNGWR